jgi:hypothetical protein
MAKLQRELARKEKRELKQQKKAAAAEAKAVQVGQPNDEAEAAE